MATAELCAAPPEAASCSSREFDSDSLGLRPLPGLDRLSEALRTEGVWSSDGAAGEDFCAALRCDAEALYAARLLLPSLNRVATARGGAQAGLSPPPGGALCAKVGVHELELVLGGARCGGDARSLAPTLSAWLDRGAPELLGQLQAAAPWLQLDALDTCKVQLNCGEGGAFLRDSGAQYPHSFGTVRAPPAGCFPLHFDTTAETSRRCLTAILYLSQEWAEGGGGELEAHPFPLAPRAYAPLAGRLLCFSSVALLHRVRRCRHRRVCVSLWFSSASSPQPSFPMAYPAWVGAEGGGEAAALLAFLRRPANARLLCKVLLAEEWAESIRDAFPSGEGVEGALALHFAEAAELAGRVNAPLLALLRDTLPLRQAAE